MSRFFDISPSKKPKPTAARGGSGAASSDGVQTVGEVFPGRICPDDECPPPKQLLVRYKNGRPFVVCSNNVRDDPTSCQFTANKFGRDRGKEAAPLPARAAVGFGFLEGELSKKRDVGRQSTGGVRGSVCAYPLNQSSQR